LKKGKSDAQNVEVTKKADKRGRRAGITFQDLPAPSSGYQHLPRTYREASTRAAEKEDEHTTRDQKSVTGDQSSVTSEAGKGQGPTKDMSLFRTFGS